MNINDRMSFENVLYVYLKHKQRMRKKGGKREGRNKKQDVGIQNK